MTEEEKPNNVIKLVERASPLDVVLAEQREMLALRRTEVESLAVAAHALTALAQAVSALPAAMNQAVNLLVKGGGVNSILGGLAQHDGRKALDARTMKQNAIEIVEQMEQVFKKYNERMSSQELRSPDIVDAEKQAGFSDGSETRDI